MWLNVESWEKGDWMTELEIFKKCFNLTDKRKINPVRFGAGSDYELSY